MKSQIPYLNRSLSIDIADEYLMGIIEPNEIEVRGTPEEIVAEALSNPVDAEGKIRSGGSESNVSSTHEGGGQRASFEEFLQGAHSVLIVINDATRPTPTPSMLGVLLPEIQKVGISLAQVMLIVATGAHRAPTEEEYRQILGDYYGLVRERCVAHNARNEADLVDLGQTRNGTPIVLNKMLFEADRIIVTGSVEPHYFAGFTGGRKAFLPGLAAHRTIEANHKLALSPMARALTLDGNPVHEDMIDALRLIKAPVFALMAVLDKDQKVAAATAGDIVGSFYAAIDTAQRIFCVKVPAKADVVISVAKFPMDIDLYQSQKAIDNGSLVLKDGGTLILISSCRSGIGDEAYANLLARASSPQDALEKIQAGYKLGYHKAAKMAAVSARATVKALTELPPERVRSMFIEPITSLQDALDTAITAALSATLGEERSTETKPTVVVLLDGCVTVPLVSKGP